MQRILAADFYQISVVKPRSLHYGYFPVFLTGADMMCQKIRHRTKTTDKPGLNQNFVTFPSLLKVTKSILPKIERNAIRIVSWVCSVRFFGRIDKVIIYFWDLLTFIRISLFGFWCTHCRFFLRNNQPFPTACN